MKKNNIYIIFSFLAVAVVLWQLFSSGYVLILDMVWGPNVNLTVSEGTLINALPLRYIISFLTLVFNSWIAQKIILIIVFFLLFYLPLHFFKKIFNLEHTYGAEYFVSLVFAINPFVYERFIAGQWFVILGYALLFPVVVYLIEFCREWNYKNGFKLFLSIIVLGIASIHILVIAVIIIFISILANLIYLKGNVIFFKRSVQLGLFVLIASGYWLVPAMLEKTTALSILSPAHWATFKTVSSGWGTVGNVLSLQGFWGENVSWFKMFLLPREGGWNFLTSIIFLFSIIILGIYSGLKDRWLRGTVSFIIFFTILATIFSCGLGVGIFKNLNMWMFEHIFFWKGFRDSQKWSAVIALSYALLAGLGTRAIILWFRDLKYKRIAFCILLAIPFLYTPMMLFGFVGQLKTVQYPESWGEVNNIINEDKNCRALFLPWHQYYSLKFNNSIITANPSSHYFGCDIIHGKNMELGTIKSQGGHGEEYDLIERIVTDNNANPDATIEFLRKKGVNYIIFTNDAIYEDAFKYPFLDSRLINKVINNPDIYLYTLY